MPESLADRYLKLSPEKAYKLINQEINAFLEHTAATDPVLHHLAEIVRFLDFMSQVQYREIEALKEQLKDIAHTSDTPTN